MHTSGCHGSEVSAAWLRADRIIDASAQTSDRTSQQRMAGRPQCGLQMSRGVGKNSEKHKLALVSHTTDTLQHRSVMELTLTRSPHCSASWVWLWFTAWHLYGSTRLITCNLKLWQSDFKESDFREITRPRVLLFQPVVQVQQPLHTGLFEHHWWPEGDILICHRCPARLIWSQLCGFTPLHLNNVVAVSVRKRNKSMSGMFALHRFHLARS